MTGIYLFPLTYWGVLFSIYLLYKYGEGDFTNLDECITGPYKRIGIRHFKSKEFGNNCSVFYPADSHDKLGEFGQSLSTMEENPE